MAEMRAYGQDVHPSEFKVTYLGRTFSLLGCDCGRCQYVWFVPAVSEHEPSYCPNCGMKFVGVRPGPEVSDATD